MKRKCEIATPSIYAEGLSMYTTELWNNGAPEGDTRVTNTDPTTHACSEFRLHRFLLMANSKFFRMMLAPEVMAESTTGVVSLNADDDAWTTAVKFMYTQTLDFGIGAQARRAVRCLILADFLLAKSLSDACMNWALSRLSRTNCCALFAHGADWRDNGSPIATPARIVDAAVEYIGTCVSYEPDDSIFWRGFRALRPTSMLELLRSTRLRVICEAALLHAVSTWAEITKPNFADLSTIAGSLHLHHVPQTILASLILAPPPHLASIKDALSSALAVSVTGAPACPPRDRVALGMLFMHRSPSGVEMLVGNPASKLHRIGTIAINQNGRLVVSGGLVYILGGELAQPLYATSAVEIFDPNSGTVTSGPCMRMPLIGFSCAADSERIVVCGGEQENGLVSQYVEVLRAHKWTVMAALNTRRKSCASVICHGRVYVIGGLSPSGLVLSSVEIVEVAAPFVMLPNITLPFARHSHSAVAIERFIYVLGGTDEDDVPLNDASCYDTIAATWIDTPNMLAARTDFSAAAFEGRIYVCGGASPECEVYCPESRTWSALTLALPASIALALA